MEVNMETVDPPQTADKGETDAPPWEAHVPGGGSCTHRIAQSSIR